MQFHVGTHDIQNVNVSPDRGEIQVSGDYISGSEAIGALIIVYSTSDETTIFYHNAQRTLNGQRTPNGPLEAIVSDLPGGQYSVSVFVVEKNGEPFIRAATVPKPVTVPIGTKQGEFVILALLIKIIICQCFIESCGKPPSPKEMIHLVYWRAFLCYSYPESKCDVNHHTQSM